MRNCSRCGGHLHRIHRTFAERFAYLAIYKCHECKDISYVSRRYRHHLGQFPRCPKCGALRITKLKQRDYIDPLNTGFLNLLERICGGVLFHCRFCRLQFYDRRKVVADKPTVPSVESPDAAVPVE